MNRVLVNIVFILLLSLVIFPVKEGIDLLLSNVNNQTTTTKEEDDDDADATTDIVKKIDFKLKFEIPQSNSFTFKPKEKITLKYIDLCVLLPINLVVDVQTPPPNC